jgi:hypothetical protein
LFKFIVICLSLFVCLSSYAEDKVREPNACRELKSNSVASVVEDFLKLRARRFAGAIYQPFAVRDTYVGMLGLVNESNPEKKEAAMLALDKIAWGSLDYGNKKGSLSARQRLFDGFAILRDSLLPDKAGADLTVEDAEEVVSLYGAIAGQEPARARPGGRPKRTATAPATVAATAPVAVAVADADKSSAKKPKTIVKTDLVVEHIGDDHTELRLSFSDDLLLQYQTKIHQLKKSFTSHVVTDASGKWTILYASKNGTPQGYVAYLAYKSDERVEVTSLESIATAAKDGAQLAAFWQQVARTHRFVDKIVELQIRRETGAPWIGTLQISAATIARTKFRSDVDLEHMELWIGDYILYGLAADAQKTELYLKSDQKQLRLNAVTRDGALIVTSAQ